MRRVNLRNSQSLQSLRRQGRCCDVCLPGTSFPTCADRTPFLGELPLFSSIWFWATDQIPWLILRRPQGWTCDPGLTLITSYSPGHITVTPKLPHEAGTMRPPSGWGWERETETRKEYVFMGSGFTWLSWHYFVTVLLILWATLRLFPKASSLLKSVCFRISVTYNTVLMNKNTPKVFLSTTYIFETSKIWVSVFKNWVCSCLVFPQSVGLLDGHLGRAGTSMAHRPVPCMTLVRVGQKQSCIDVEGSSEAAAMMLWRPLPDGAGVGDTYRRSPVCPHSFLLFDCWPC